MKLSGGVALTIAGGLVGLALGYQLWGDDMRIVETAAPEVRQKDSSLVLERRPDPTAKPVHAIPKGATVERVVTVTVQPSPSSTLPIFPRKSGVDNSGADVSKSVDLIHDTPTRIGNRDSLCSCAPVHVDLSLVREANGMRRVIASARGGTILGGVDVPVESAAPEKRFKWALGPSWDLATQRWGVAADRDIDRIVFLRIPARAGLTLGPGMDRGVTGSVRVQLRF
jgi:hypothetical protein